MSRINLHNYEAFLLDYFEGNLSEALSEELKIFALTHPELEVSLDATEWELPALTGDELTADFKQQLKKTGFDLPVETLLNYLEGNLPDAEREIIEIRLLNDKTLAADFDLFKKTILRAEAADVFENKTQLLKTGDDLALNSRAVAYFENTLHASEKKIFESELKISQALQNELRLVSKTRLHSDLAIIYPDKAALKKEGRVVALFGLRSLAAAAAVLLLLGLGFIFKYYRSAVDAPPVLAKKETKKNQQSGKENRPSPETSRFSEQPKPEILQKQQHLAAANKINGIKLSLKKDSAAPVIQPLNPVAENKGSQTPVPAKETVVEEKKLVAIHQNPASLSPNHPDSLPSEMVYTKQNLLPAFDDNEDDGDNAVQPQRGFWKRAVHLAKRANQLGIKAVDGTEEGHERYSLSFNAFSVEKH